MSRERPILHLNLHKKWFDMIASGEKKEEYRVMKPYWAKVFVVSRIKVSGKHYEPEDVTIRFSNGYAKDRRQMDVKCMGLSRGYGVSEWGAEAGKPYYILRLGKVIEL